MKKLIKAVLSEKVDINKKFKESINLNHPA
jgi:hypothetical protein